jgi:hypothetical protein
MAVGPGIRTLALQPDGMPHDTLMVVPLREVIECADILSLVNVSEQTVDSG